MAETNYQEQVEQVIQENPYLALSTTDGTAPWVAPIEYFRDEVGNFYFFSTTDSRHAQHIKTNETVAVALWGNQDQPEYSPDLNATLNGVQIRGKATRLTEAEYPEIVQGAVEELGAPMPPYAAFKIEPQRVYLPVIEDGINKRVEVDMG